MSKSRSDRVGNSAENTLRLMAERARFTINKSEQDREGWDFLLEFQLREDETPHEGPVSLDHDLRHVKSFVQVKGRLSPRMCVNCEEGCHAARLKEVVSVSVVCEAISCRIRFSLVNSKELILTGLYSFDMIQDLPNRLRSWEKRHDLRIRVRKLSRHIFVEGQPGWYTLLGLIAAWWAPLWLFTINPEVHMRWTGMLLQIGGVGTVAWGLSKTRELFDRPGIWQSIVRWVAAIPDQMRAPRTITASASGKLPLFSVSASVEVHSSPGDKSLEEKVTWLLNQVEKLEGRISDLRREGREQEKKLESLIDEEASQRESADENINRQIEEVAVGGLHLELMGLVWLVVGIVLSSFPAVLGGIFSPFG